MSSSKSEPVGVGVAGLGRSGWDIHIKAMRELPGRFKVVAVLDDLADRRRQAVGELGCAACGSYGELLADPSVEFVVVAMPTGLHAEWSIKALRAGKSVVCEKPMARDLAETDAMIAAEKKSGRSLTVFQNRRYELLYLKVKEIIESGALGRVTMIKHSAHMFRRRWDWQTLKEFGGGMLRNWGAHSLDTMMELFGPAEPEIFCKMEQVLASGDAEDFVKLILAAPDAPTIDLEISSNCAYPQSGWLVMGQKGTLCSEGDGLRWKVVRGFEELPERKVDAAPTPDRGYNSEKLEFEEFSWSPEPGGPSADVRFYRDLYAYLREGAEQPVTTESVRRRMAVIDHCLTRCGFS